MPFVVRRLQILPQLALAAFALRAFVPLGYMPDFTGPFGRIVLCHGDPAFAILSSWEESIAAAHAHDHAHDPHGQHRTSAGSQAHSEHLPLQQDAPQAESHDAWEHCQFGSTLAGSALFAEHAFGPLSIDPSTPGPETSVAVARPSLSPYSARAPPSV